MNLSPRRLVDLVLALLIFIAGVVVLLAGSVSTAPWR